MRTEQENLEALSRAALNEARTEAKRVVGDAEAKADQVRQQSQAESQAERKRILAQAQQESDRLRSEAIAGAELEARMLKLGRRERLLERVFDAARAQLPAVAERADYDHTVQQLAREAIKQVGAEAVDIRVDEKAQALLTKEVVDGLAREMGVELQLGDTLLDRTGVIAETTDGRRRYDNSLQARLTRMQDALRAPVYHMLVGAPS